MKRFTLIKKASPVNYALESTRPPSGGRVSPYSGRRGRRPRRPMPCHSEPVTVSLAWESAPPCAAGRGHPALRHVWPCSAGDGVHDVPS